MVPQAVQVAEGVFQFQVPMPPNPDRPDRRERYTLVYALETPQGWVMIDTGTNSDLGFEALQQQVAETGVAPRDFSLIVITHGHADHLGLADRTRALTGAPVALHRLDATNPYVLAFDPGVPMPTIDVELAGGEELLPGSGLWTIWTPGHTPGHLCIHDRQRRLLFSGDHLLPRTTPNVSLYPGVEGNPLKQFMEGHLALTSLDVRFVHPAHEYSFAGLVKRVEEIISHHERRADEILAMLTDGPRTAWDITAAVAWNAGPWGQLNRQARLAALWETTAHLHYLVEQGRLSRQENGSRVLLEEFRRALGASEEGLPIALVGTGRLGRATLGNRELAAAGYKIVCAFDADPRQVGERIGDLRVEPMERLGPELAAAGIRTAIVSIPPRHIQDVIDRLVVSNVQSIVNYTPTTPRVPSHVTVHAIDALQAMQSTTYTQRL